MREFRFNPEERTPLVGALIAGPSGIRKMRLVFDTGCAVTQVHSETMRKLGYDERAKVATASFVGVGGKTDEGYVVEVRSLHVLGQKAANMQIAAFPMKYLDEEGIDGLLGWDLISKLHLEMNGPEGTLKIF